MAFVVVTQSSRCRRREESQTSTFITTRVSFPVLNCTTTATNIFTHTTTHRSSPCKSYNASSSQAASSLHPSVSLMLHEYSKPGNACFWT
ncbi:hypothetical protein WG66_004428 [Moniliophthora roreri]|nr:hypothetical protein WG66_004428 [Moniliophthora roreri]